MYNKRSIRNNQMMQGCFGEKTPIILNLFLVKPFTEFFTISSTTAWGLTYENIMTKAMHKFKYINWAIDGLSSL